MKRTVVKKKKQIRRSKGKTKGSSFERQMCRKLSLWWTDNRQDDVFWRNSMRKTTKNPDTKFQLGDLCAIDPDACIFISKVSIEFKSGYSRERKGRKNIRNTPWDILDIIDGKGDNIFFSFWSQTVRDAQISGRMPMLIFKRDYHDPVICTSWLVYNNFCTYFNSYDNYVIRLANTMYDDLSLMNLDKFLDWVSPDFFRGYGRK